MKRYEKIILIIFLCLLAALLAASLVSACSGQGGGPGIVINEVVSSNSLSLPDATLGSPDWIELYNGGKAEVSLKGYRLSNESKSGKCVFADVTIPAGGYLKVFAAKNGAPGDTGAVMMGFNLSKGGEELYLQNPDGMVLQMLAVPALTTDESWARRADGAYGYCMAPTPGAGNDGSEIKDTSALKAQPASGALILSEVLPRPQEGVAWVEFYNAGKTDVNLADYCLTDNKGNPDKWRLPKRTLGAGEYAVAEFTQEAAAEGRICVPFKLGSRDTAIYLCDISANPVCSLEWPAEIARGLSAVSGSGFTAVPTKGAKNSEKTFASGLPGAMGSEDTVRISEVLRSNKYSLTDGEGGRSEWVELFNGGASAVSLSGYYLSDDPGRPFKWAFPDTTIEAGGYRVVFLSGKQSSAEELHASFRLSAGETGITLTNGSYHVDTVTLPGTMPCDVSAGRDAAGSLVYFNRPTPNRANANGVADLGGIGCFDGEGVYISEVCAANAVGSGKNDWLELHNGSGLEVDLSGYYLSDDADDLKQWRIPQLKIAAGGYAAIETSSQAAKRGKNTAAFGISPMGETLFLCDPQGNILDVFETGKLRAGVTSGRVEDNDKLALVYFTTPTRGKANAAQYSTGYAAAPAFSQTGLYQTKEFKLTLTSSTPGAVIHYTTNGTVPTKSSAVYTAPITIGKNKPVRAVAYADGLLPSDAATQTYLFDAPHTVPVFCITGKQSEMKKVIESDLQRTKPEFPAYVEYYETDGTLAVSFPSDVRPKGRASLRMPQNSLALTLRGGYGQGSVAYPFFPDSEVTTYKALALRTSGQDTPAARMRDTYFQRVTKGLRVDAVKTKFAVVYFNGEYSGLYDMNEEQNEDFFTSYYGVDSDNVEIINSNAIVVAGDNREYKHIYKIAEEWNLKDDRVFAEFAELVDTEACIDYLCAQTYFGNGDLVNVRFWRAKDYSVKWRPLLFDLDFCLRANDGERDVFDRYLIPEPTISGGTIIVEMHIFGGLMKNKAWRDRFVERYVELAYTQFDPERILTMFDEMKAEMLPEMAQTIDRWRMPSSMEYWETQTGKLRAALEKRQAIALNQMQRYFKVSDETMRKYKEKYSTQN